VAKIAKEEQQMLTECAEKTVERMKATINKISKGGKR